MHPLTPPCCLPPRRLPACRAAGSRTGRWLISTASLLAWQALAATTPAPADTALPAAPGLRLLDKALSGEVSTGDHNLDLLLDAQRKGLATLDEAPTPGRMPERGRSERLAGQALPEPQRQADPQRLLPATPPAALPTAPLILVLPSASPVAPPRLARDWSGNSAAAQAAGTGQRGVSGSTGPRAPDLFLRDLILDGLALIKVHLFAILGACAAIALLVLGLKAYSRRI